MLNQCKEAEALFTHFIASWNARSWQGSTERMTEDATIVGVTGERRSGRSEIGQAYSDYFATLPSGEFITDVSVTSVRAITPQVTILDASLSYSGRRMCGSMICVESDDGWKIHDWRAFVVFDVSH